MVLKEGVSDRSMFFIASNAYPFASSQLLHLDWHFILTYLKQSAGFAQIQLI